MASAFGHAIASAALGKTFSSTLTSWKFWLLGAICSILPDADVLAFKLGIAYKDFWGHRGFSHSLLFALVTGTLVTFLFFRKNLTLAKSAAYISYFSLATASHGLLDAMTSGGLGVAFFSPWNDTRYFLPWRPIKVSPIGVESFFSEWGMKVISSELIWIGIPCVGYIITIKLIKKYVIK